MSKKKFTNKTHIEGILYSQDLKLKTSGENSTHPGTQFITGSVEVATDDAMTNIVPVHFTYVTQNFGFAPDAKKNPSYQVLLDIIDGKIKTHMDSGDGAKVTIDSSIGLNDFYTDRNGTVELVSAKRNENGFIHVVPSVSTNEKTRNTFETDIVITNVIHQEADPENDKPEKAIIKGAVFDYRKALLPVEFSVVNPNAISYFLGLGISPKTPVFTLVKGRQVSEVVVKKIEKVSAWGDVEVEEVNRSRKDWVITWASDPGVWDDESTITGQELNAMMSERERELATKRARFDEYRNGTPAISTSASEYLF